jgi:hypothetical protein
MTGVGPLARGQSPPHWSLAAGVDLFTLLPRLGTSLAMVDATYGHLAPDVSPPGTTPKPTVESAIHPALRVKRAGCARTAPGNRDGYADERT